MCKAFLAQLRRAYPDIQAAGLDVAAVTLGQPEATGKFCRTQNVPFTCLSDPERAAYTAYGLLANPNVIAQSAARSSTWLAFTREALKGNLNQPPPRGQSASQLSGAFIIDSNGTVEYAHRSQHVADLISDEDLAAALASLAITPAVGASRSR